MSLLIPEAPPLHPREKHKGPADLVMNAHLWITLHLHFPLINTKISTQNRPLLHKKEFLIEIGIYN